MADYDPWYDPGQFSVSQDFSVPDFNWDFSFPDFNIPDFDFSRRATRISSNEGGTP